MTVIQMTEKQYEDRLVLLSEHKEKPVEESAQLTLVL